MLCNIWSYQLSYNERATQGSIFLVTAVVVLCWQGVGVVTYRERRRVRWQKEEQLPRLLGHLESNDPPHRKSPPGGMALLAERHALTQCKPPPWPLMWVEPAGHQSYRDLACKMAGPAPGTVIRGNNRKRRNANARAHRKRSLVPARLNRYQGNPGIRRGRRRETFLGALSYGIRIRWSQGTLPSQAFFEQGTPGLWKLWCIWHSNISFHNSVEKLLETEILFVCSMI